MWLLSLFLALFLWALSIQQPGSGRLITEMLPVSKFCHLQDKVSGMQTFFLSWICSIWLLALPLVPNRGMYGGHASFQPYMEAKHWYLCWACYEGFWQALWLSWLTLSRPGAQCGKSGKERQREENWLSTSGPCRTGEDPPSPSLTPASSWEGWAALKGSDINTLRIHINIQFF